MGEDTTTQTTAIEKPSFGISQYGTKELTARIKEEAKMRKLITGFINEYMIDGVDYGRIHFSKTCANAYNPELCKINGHFSKPTLFKPGAEKFTSLFHLRAEYAKDTDSWEMAGSPNGLFCYVCRLIDPYGNLAGEGRGSCTVESKKGDENTAMKIAEKRAKIDAVLSTGALSDFFTQDTKSDEEVKKSDTTVGTTAPRVTPARVDQIDLIKLLSPQLGYSEQTMLKFVEMRFKKKTLAELSTTQAYEIIKSLTARIDKKNELTDQDLQNIDNMNSKSEEK